MSKILKTALTVLLSIVCLFGMVSCGKEETPPTSSTPSKPSGGSGTVPVYRIEYVADGVVVGLGDYIHEGSEIVEPQVPKKAGYTGRWEDYELDGGYKRVNAIYELVTYSVTYHVVQISNGKVTVDYRGTFDDYWSKFESVQKLNLPTSYTVESEEMTVKRLPEISTGEKVSEEFSEVWYVDENCTEVFTGKLPGRYAEDLHLYAKQTAMWLGPW